jgi:hypothetical protein
MSKKVGITYNNKAFNLSQNAMSINISSGGIKIGIGIASGGSGGWTPQRIESKLLYWGKVSEITGGTMPNKVGTDHIDIGGAAGTYTFQVPNTAPYIAADTDYIWFKTDASQRTTTEAELVGYDLPRTPVKYDNVSTYAIREILILKAGETLTTAEENHLRDYMNLSMWWSNVLSSHGVWKGNRGTSQSVWVAEGVYEAEYLAVYNVMTNKPTGLIAAAQNTFLATIKIGGVLAKLDRLFVFAQYSNADGEALLDWIDPTRSSSLIGNPTFNSLEGFTGSVSNAILSEYNPTTDGSNYTQNSACAFAYNRANKAGSAGTIIGVGPNSLSTELGIYTRYTNNNYLGLINSGAPDTWTVGGNGDARGMFIISRLNNDIVVYKNKSGTSATVTSTRIPTHDITFLCCNQVQVNNIDPPYNLPYFQFSTDQISVGGFGSNLSQSDVDCLTDAFEVYMDSNSKGVI